MKFPIIKSDVIDVAKHTREAEKFDELEWHDPKVTEAFNYILKNNACPICGSTLQTIARGNDGYERICPIDSYVWDEE